MIGDGIPLDRARSGLHTQILSRAGSRKRRVTWCLVPIMDLLTAEEAYRRRRMLEQTNAAYAALRADPQRWAEELEERAAWDATLADGMADTEFGEPPRA